jgi:hypothetical protein
MTSSLSTTPARLLVALALALATFAFAPSASAAPAFADADTATVTPGVMMFTDGAQCTANFIYSDGTNAYIGYAAHCAGLGAATDTNGCTAGSFPLGTPVEIEGATQPGTLAYSSWLAMQQAGETDPDACGFNDFALVEIDPADVGRTNPSVPFFGGPTGLDANGSTTGAQVYSYGNSSLRLGLSPLSPKYGTNVTDGGNGWTQTVYTATPGIPGDSGSGFLSADGTALGTLSTVAIAPLPASNGVSDLAKELDYMRSHGGPDASLVNGTEAFDPIL